MDFRPDSHEVGERFKLIMHRFIARQVRKDPSCIERAKQQVAARVEVADNDAICKWIDLWNEVLSLPVDEVARFLGSRSYYARQAMGSSPFTRDVTGLDFTDVDWRKRGLRKARMGIIFLHERKKVREPDVHLNAFFWSDYSQSIAQGPVISHKLW